MIFHLTEKSNVLFIFPGYCQFVHLLALPSMINMVNAVVKRCAAGCPDSYFFSSFKYQPLHLLMNIWVILQHSEHFSPRPQLSLFSFSTATHSLHTDLTSYWHVLWGYSQHWHMDRHEKSERSCMLWPKEDCKFKFGSGSIKLLTKGLWIICSNWVMK